MNFTTAQNYTEGKYWDKFRILIWEFLFCTDPRGTPAKSKSTSIWKAHMIGHVDFDLAGGGDMSMLEIERIVNFL